MRERERLVSIQYLRALAACGVALFHLNPQFTLGAYGVDLFFVISGYIMVATTPDDRSPAEFMRKRALRIVPLYALLTTVMFVLLVVAPSIGRPSNVTVMDYVQSLLFVPYQATVTPVLAQGWTLNYEMFFYLIFAATLFMPRRIAPAACIAIILALVVVGSIAHPTGFYAKFYTAPFLLEFALGVGAAVISSRVGYAKALLVFAAISGLALLMSPHLAVYRVVLFGGLAGCLVIAGIWLERSGFVPAWKPGIIAGDASYSIYLTGSFCYSANTILQRHYSVPIALIFAATIAVGVATHLLIEKPLLRMMKRPSFPPIAAPAI